MSIDDFNPELREQVEWAIEQGYFVKIGDSYEITSAGCRFFGLPEDKTLLQVGLETLLEEIVDEEFTKQAKRPFPAAKQ